MPELLPHNLSDRLARMRSEMVERVQPMAVNEMAAMAERQAKINASSGSHAAGTPTPAQKGSGPARVSGDLVRGITHTHAEQRGSGWSAKIGVPSGIQHGGYGGGRGRTRRASSGRGGGAPLGVIARALEHDLNYPFLRPAARFAMSQAPMYMRRAIEQFVRSHR